MTDREQTFDERLEQCRALSARIRGQRKHLARSERRVRNLEEGLRQANEDVDRLEAALRIISHIGGDELSADECVRVLALARGFAARMIGAETVGGSLADEIESLVARTAPMETTA